MTKIIEPDKQTNIFRRPSSEYGIWSWITTVDHKKIGIMYGYAAFFFLLIGGLEALVLRIQLAQPDNNFLSAAEYNAMFTMHGQACAFSLQLVTKRGSGLKPMHGLVLNKLLLLP